jgi:radical SAM superfamily enzyme YgiQ (UPF0313 family)
MQILFVTTPNFNDPSSADWHTDIRYTVSFLRRQGIETGYLSLPLTTDFRSWRKDIARMQPKNIFLQFTEENYGVSMNFLKQFRKIFPKTRVIVGGIPVEFNTEEFLIKNSEIDWVIAGERELTLLESLQRLQRDQSCADVKGLNSLEFSNASRPLISNLDLLGEIVYDGIDEMLSFNKNSKVGYLLSSRGCYAQCSFCAIPSFYKSSRTSWRGRSVFAVIDELEHLSTTFGINYFVFEDDNFFGPGIPGQERAKQIAAELLHRKVGIRFFFCCRLNDIKKDSFYALKEAGLDGIGIGIESTCPESLRLFQKGLLVEDIYPTLEFLDELKIKVEVNMIFFDPYLSLKGVRSNIGLLEYLKKKDRFFYSSSFPFNELKPFCWSPIAKQLKSEGLLNELDYSCYYKDPKVGILVNWTRNIREYVESFFKRRNIFLHLENKEALENPPVKSQMLTASVRYWIGLYLLPRYLSVACDLLEESAFDLPQQLEELQNKFFQEIAPLIRLQKGKLGATSG